VKHKRTFWTPEQIRLLTEQYPDTPTKQIADQIGRTVSQCYGKAYQLGLLKSAAFHATELSGRTNGTNRGTSTRFAPGITPWNKGTTYQAGGRSAETRFKPGERRGIASKIYQPIGTERISKDGYLERKINDDFPIHRRWRAVHLLAWEAANGPLPDGHAICFRDGNKQNRALENLELVSRTELMRRNTVHQLPKEVAQLVQLRGALVRKINNRTKDRTE